MDARARAGRPYASARRRRRAVQAGAQRIRRQQTHQHSGTEAKAAPAPQGASILLSFVRKSYVASTEGRCSAFGLAHPPHFTSLTKKGGLCGMRKNGRGLASQRGVITAHEAVPASACALFLKSSRPSLTRTSPVRAVSHNDPSPAHRLLALSPPPPVPDARGQDPAGASAVL